MVLVRVSPELPCSPFLFSFKFNHHNNLAPPICFKSLSTSHHYRRSTSSFISPLTATSPTIKHHQTPQKQKQEDNDQEEEEVEVIESPPSLSDVTAEKDTRHLSSPPLEVKQLEELPEQWRRSKIAWLCKEVPSHKPATLFRLLNAQRKWLHQDDAAYVALHCMRIRENDASYRVYKWMSQQHRYNFDFPLVSKLADYLGKDRKIAKCRELFDAIVTQGEVPSESTFHILIVAYLSAPVEGSLDEACFIYNKMIQLGGHKPRLSLHNSLFRALISSSGPLSKQYLKQAEFIYHNIQTSGLEIHKDVYAGLIWLHSYQDVIDRERIAALREEMRSAGFKENTDVLLSVMRASSKEGLVEKTEETWLKLLESGSALPSQAFVYRMELYAKVGEPLKSLEIFKTMKNQIPATVPAYHKIIEIMSRAREVDIAEQIMDEFTESGMKPLTPAFLDLMLMYFYLNMHDKLEVTFSKCLARCKPNRTLYNIYLESLVRNDNLEKAEEIFNEMHANATIGAGARSCNTILGGFLASDEFDKAGQIYGIMRQKRYVVDPQFTEKLEYALSLKQKVVKRRVSMKLDQEQREILVGLLMGGVRIESDEDRRNHAVHFEFSENPETHSILKMHIHERFYEWLTSSSKSADEETDGPFRFSTIAHSYFGFFADKFWTKGRLTVPNLIHRWLSPRVLAYWYMFGGFKIASGDILLKLKVGNREDVERVVKALHEKSLACKVKRKGRVYWIRLQGKSAALFWEMVEPYVLDNTKDHLQPCSSDTGTHEVEDDQNYVFDSESDSDNR